MFRIVLASASPRRRELLQSLGLEFEVLPAGVNEDFAGRDPVDMAESLAERKARAVAGRVGDGLILGADTVVFQRGRFLGKPEGPEEAAAMLTALQGDTHEVLTGVSLIRMPDGHAVVDHERTRVHFRAMTAQEIDWYVATGEPLDKAGAYAIQGLGGLFVRGIKGCWFNVVGLPLPLLSGLFRRQGVDLLNLVGTNWSSSGRR